MKKFSIIFYAASLSSLLMFSACEKKGCTDPLSSNYDIEASLDDGSCSYYYGGRDYGQLDVGSEVDLDNEYQIYIDDEFIGRSSYYFPNGLGCGNPQAVGTILTAGSHVVTAIGNGGHEIREGVVNLNPQDCNVVLIENLRIKTNTNPNYNEYPSGGNNGEYPDSGGTGGYPDSGGSDGGYPDSGGSDDGNNNNSGTASVTFWVNQDLGCGNIYVEVTSYGSQTISSYYYGGNPGCNASGSANFTLSHGTYSWNASSDGDCTWSGSITVDGNCETMQLTM